MSPVVRPSYVRIAVVLLGVLGLIPRAAATETPAQAVTLQLPHDGPACIGDVATLSWVPPVDIADVTEYEIENRIFHPGGPSFFFTRVPSDQTSTQIPLRFGANTFIVYAISSTGAKTPIASTSVMVNAPPSAMHWEAGGSSVGDGTATVRFAWGGPPTWSVTGGTIPATVRITASPGGATIDAPASALGPYDASVTFNGLTNGVAYTFTATVFNACGSSQAATSPTFTPGLAPEWTRSSPPLTVGPGQYVYKFAAVGDPSPTYYLIGAPAWLEIAENGLVKGRPPAGTESFTYTVVAANGVGVAFLQPTDAIAGPFRVEVR